MSTTSQKSVNLTFELDGEEVTCSTGSQTTAIDLLRDQFRRIGVRSSCERGVCGACTVLIDGSPVASCSTFAFDLDGTAVETVTGLQGPDGTPSPEQQAFTERGGFQCGYCTSGMLMLTRGLLRADPTPSRETVREWISSNTCRCTGYEMIMESVERAAVLTAESQELAAVPEAAQ